MFETIDIISYQLLLIQACLVVLGLRYLKRSQEPTWPAGTEEAFIISGGRITMDEWSRMPTEFKTAFVKAASDVKNRDYYVQSVPHIGRKANVFLGEKAWIKTVLDEGMEVERQEANA